MNEGNYRSYKNMIITGKCCKQHIEMSTVKKVLLKIELRSEYNDNNNNNNNMTSLHQIHPVNRKLRPSEIIDEAKYDDTDSDSEDNLVIVGKQNRFSVRNSFTYFSTRLRSFVKDSFVYSSRRVELSNESHPVESNMNEFQEADNKNKIFKTISSVGIMTGFILLVAFGI